jgi:hypothetical protein
MAESLILIDILFITYILCIMNIEDIKNNYPWKQVFEFSDGTNLDEFSEPSNFPFQMEDVAEILNIEDGQNDGQSWIILVKLNNGLYGFLTAWCDYTGFDCQAGGHSYVSLSKEKLIRFGMGEDDRKRFGLSLPGEDFFIDSNH